jgi:hypothetical protein
MMSAPSIQAKVKKGLAKAIAATGSPTSLKVYLVNAVTTNGSPLSPGITTSTNVLLTNAAFKSYDAKLFGGAMLASDRALVCDNVTSIKQGDTIQEGTALYIVVAVDIKAPTSDVLAYILQLRLK